MKMKPDGIKAVILAGGKGTRLAGIGGEIPKPLVPVCGKPVLERQIEVLAREGITDITIVIGHLGGMIKEYFSDGSRFGVKISYFEETTPLGTGGALPLLPVSEDILLCSGDLVFDFTLSLMLDYHRRKGALITVLAHPNSHPADSTAIVADSEGRILKFVPKEQKHGDYANLSNAGIQLISRRFLETLNISGAADLDRDILAPACESGGVYAYRCTEYVHDMGTPKRLKKAEEDISRGIPAMRNLTHKQKAVFLDRDGTINVYKGYITNPDDIELLPGAAEAVKMINESGMLAVIATNQAVIARGECTFEELAAINARLETLLGKKGAYTDRLYFCPHHPDGGFPGERAEYKTVCECRKPAPGMLLRAAEDMNIDLAASFMVGDSLRDRETAVNAGCRGILLSCGKYEEEAQGLADYPDLLSFAKTL